MNGRVPFGEDVTLALSILAAFTVASAYLRWRGRRALLRAIWPPAMLALAFSMLDGLVTLHGTFARPGYEANPFIRAFLLRAGWWGLCAAFFVWILAWTVFIEGLESLRVHLAAPAHPARPPAACMLIRAAQLYTVYAVAAGHLDGFTSWTHAPATIYVASSGLLVVLRQHAAWTIPVYPLAYLLYPSLAFGAALTLCHYGVGCGVASMIAGRQTRQVDVRHAG